MVHNHGVLFLCCAAIDTDAILCLMLLLLRLCLAVALLLHVRRVRLLLLLLLVGRGLLCCRLEPGKWTSSL